MRSTQICRFSEQLLSTVHRGTAFEYRALALLTKYMSMSLTRVGGSHDGGVDLIGWWWVPDDGENQNPTTTVARDPSPPKATELRAWNDATNQRRRLRVLAQCKAEKRKMGPAYLRELEGVVYRHAASASASSPVAASSIPDAFLRLPPYAHAHSHSHPTPTSAKSTTAEHPPPVALLVSQSPFTRSCLHAAYASPLPFLLVHLPPSTTTTTTSNSGSSSGSGNNTGDTLGAIFGNPALVSTRGVLGGQLEIRWERGAGATPASGVQASGSGGGGGGGGPGLWWQGQPLPSWTPDAGTADTAMFDQR